jgi:hypothetical protein
MTGDGLVHGIVENFCGQMMQRTVIRAADIHAGAAADRLKAFQNFNVLCRVIAVGAPGVIKKSGFLGFAFGACHVASPEKEPELVSTAGET